jgi:hypothetical protein
LPARAACCREADLPATDKTLATRQAVFLHTGFRSGGTWIWARLRPLPDVLGFYEPLHEAMATLDASGIAMDTAAAWASGHGDTKPYFAEFAPLLAQGAGGVAGYRRRFAYQRYFLDDGEADADLHAYIAGLLAAAAAQGRVAVLKFCRSLGRVGWMRRQFPNALHAVVIRNPMAQFLSSMAQLATGNRYFLVAALLVLARNRGEPLVQAAANWLGLHLPALPARPGTLDFELAWRHLAPLDEAGRYRVFLATWTISAVAALRAEACLVIDADRLASNAEHRAAAEAALGLALGTTVTLFTDRGDKSVPAPPYARQAHEAALGLVRECGNGLPRAALSLIEAKLAGPGWMAGAPLDPPARGYRQVLHADASGTRAMLAQNAYFAMIEASMPLRRWHGALSNRRKEGLLF